MPTASWETQARTALLDSSPTPNSPEQWEVTHEYGFIKLWKYLLYSNWRTHILTHWAMDPGGGPDTGGAGKDASNRAWGFWGNMGGAGGGSLGQRIISLDFDVSSCVCHWYPKRKMAHRNSGAKSRPWKWVGESRALWRWAHKGKGCSARREEQEGRRLRECLLVQFMIHVTFCD